MLSLAVSAASSASFRAVNADERAAWLELIPAAILSALLLPALVLSDGPRHIDLMRPELWVALPTLAFAWWKRSLGGTVVIGMLLYWLMDKVLA